MKVRLQSLLSAVLTLLVASSAFAKTLPNIDALASRPANAANPSDLVRRAGGLMKSGSRMQHESRLGVPTFVWLSDAPSLRGKGKGQGAERKEIAAARSHLGTLASIYGLSHNDVTGAVADAVLNTGKGPVVVKFKQQVNGIDIFREELTLLMNQQLDALAATGYVTSQATQDAQPGQGRWTLQASNAALRAIDDATDATLGNAQLQKSTSRDGYDFYTLATAVPGLNLEAPVRMKQVYFHLPEGLVPAYYLEVFASNVTGQVMLDTEMDQSAYAYVISAVDGSILFRKNLTEDVTGSTENVLPAGGGTYRVWADPATGIPYDTPAGNGVHPKLNPVPDGAQYPFLPQVDVTLPNYPFSQNDPWIAPGAPETVGNNADAYLDLFGLTDVNGNPTTNDGLAPIAPPADPPTGDFRAQETGADQFLHSNVPDTNHASAEARQGAIQQLFYNINFLHDWYYDSGFTESMRNAQTNNYGRGGLQNDNIRAEVQDYSGFSNANMSTPSDGSRPRMQMYNFPNKANVNQILSPAGIAGAKAMGVAMPGPQTFDITADVVLATFDGSNNVTNAAALAGKIAMFDYTAAYSTRMTKLTATDASVILMVWSSAQPNNVVNFTGFNTVWTKPIATISFNSAAPIKTQLAVPNTVTMRLHRFADRDGSLDNQIVFHEWGHYISNRLISNSAGLSNNQGRSLGEGWGDFNAMMLTVREDDTSVPSNATWGGVYSLATYATSGVPYSGAFNHGYYLGIRRTPYSTNKTSYNAFTFKHIMDGVAYPSGPPVAISTAANSEVHNSGEIWTEMLWECYASLLRDTQGATPRLTFQQAQDRMKLYFVTSLALTPPTPTFVEARDAVLAAAYATDYTDYLEFWAAFAKRGMGTGAIAPDRASTNHAGVVESFVVEPDVIVVNSATALNDSVANCDSDGVLDAGEYGKLTIAIKNVGSLALTGTTATVASSTPGVSFPNGPTVNFPSSDPLSTVATTITVALDPSVAGVQQLDFQITISDPAVTGTRSGTASFRGNTDIIPASTATDTVEAATLATTPWTRDYDVALGDVAPFSIETVTPISHRWYGPNGGAPSDNRLISPVFTVDGSGSTTMQFDHTWSFESGSYDGGVVEMSVNGGAWTDVGNGGGTINGYNGTLVATGTNPLKGRPAFVNSQATNTHTTITRAIAPGSTVRFRFRTGADDNTAGTGWRIDNIAFTGVVETPFATLVGDTGCIVATTTSLNSSPNPSAFGSPVTLTATVSSNGGTPTGTVSFYDGGNWIGGVGLSAGSAQLITSSLSLGLHTLTATYNGDANHATSSSPSIAHTVSKIATTTTVGSSNNVSDCGASVTFTATVSATSGTPGGSVTFADGASTLAIVNVVGGVATYTTSSLGGGSHTIHATYGGNGTYQSSTNTVAQTVNAVPQPSASNGGPYCEGATISLSTPSVTGATYSWTGPNGFSSALQNPTRSSATPADSGTYSVTVTLNAGCTSIAGTTSVVVNATPSTPVATNDGPYCEGSTISLFTPTVAGATYAWTGPNGFSSALQNPTRSGATLADAGTYSVTVTVNSCPSAAGTTNVVVNAIPATPSASNDGPYCEGTTISLSTPTVAGATYAWTGPNGFTSALQNPTRSSATQADAGTYNVTITVNGCPSLAGSTNVVVNATPATPSASNGGPYCEGSTISLSTPTVAGATYAWTGPNGFTSALQNPTRPSATTADAGTYSVTITVNSCASLAGSTTVVVNTIPATPTASNGGPFCQGSTITLSTPTVSGATYAWTGPNGFSSSLQNPTRSSAMPADAGTYNVTVTVNGCPSLAGSTSVVVNATPATPTISALSATSFCPGGSVVLQSSSASGNQWLLNGSPIGGATNQQYTASAAGNYTVVVTTSGCPSNASAATTVAINPAANATINAPASVVTASTGNAASVANAGAGATYAWLVTGGTLAGGQGTPNITFTAGAVGTLTLQVTVTTGGGCSDTKSANVTVTANPQKFDPNGDSTIDPSDIFYLVSYLFAGGPAPQGAAGMLSGDANGDGLVDPADIFYLVNYLFGGGPAPAALAPRVAVSSVSAPFGGAVRLGVPTVKDGRTRVPVLIETMQGSAAPQSLSLRVHLAGADGVTVHRSGAAEGRRPMFETSRFDDAGMLSYLVSFSPAHALSIDGATVVAEIEFTARQSIRLELDPALTMLSNAEGTRTATVKNGALTLGAPVVTTAKDSNPRNGEGRKEFE